MLSFEAQWRLVNPMFIIGFRRFLGGAPFLLVGFLLVFSVASCNVKVETPAPPEFSSGISYTNYLVPSVPWSIHVVRVNRSTEALEFHSTHAHGSALSLSTLTQQVQGLPPELGTPVVGVNGDFFIREKSYAGDPRGLQLLEGELLSAPIGGVSFWVDAEGLPHATNVVSLLKVTWPNGVATPFGLNEARTNNTMVLYTPALGRSTRTAPGGLELVLEPEGESPWLPFRIGTTYTVRVKEARAESDTPLETNSMVLSIGPLLLRNLPPVRAGEVLKLSTATSPDLTSVKTALSGGPLLVHNGQRQSWKRPAVEGPLPYAVRSMKERHPRTALGWDQQYFYLIEVDGRQKKLSVGMTLNELADFMIDLGCREAVNFDGGGSSMFWCNGRIVNSPCDKREREIANALIVLRRRGIQKEAAISRFQTGSK